MRSHEERLDQIIDDVARTLTSGAHPDVARRVVSQIATRRRGRPPLLVPAIVAGAVVLAAVGFVLMRAPGSSVQPSVDAPDHVVQSAPGTGPTPAPGTAQRRPGTQDALPGTQHPASATASHQQRATSRPLVSRLAVRREALLPPFVTDLSPAPLAVTPVAVPPIESPGTLELRELAVDPIPVPPVEDKGGTR